MDVERCIVLDGSIGGAVGLIDHENVVKLLSGNKFTVYVEASMIMCGYFDTFTKDDILLLTRRCNCGSMYTAPSVQGGCTENSSYCG